MRMAEGTTSDFCHCDPWITVFLPSMTWEWQNDPTKATSCCWNWHGSGEIEPRILVIQHFTAAGRYWNF